MSRLNKHERAYNKASKDLKFSHMSGNISLNNTSIDVYELSDSEYRLIKYTTNTYTNSMTSCESIDVKRDDYDNLDSSVSNQLVRFLAAEEIF